MNGKTIFTPTEARQNFFTILEKASLGKQVLIKTKRSLLRLRVENVTDTTKKEKLRALQDLEKINIRSMSITKMKKVFESRLDPFQ